MSMEWNGDNHANAKLAQVIEVAIGIEHVVGIVVVIGKQLPLPNTLKHRSDPFRAKPWPKSGNHSTGGNKLSLYIG